MKKLGWLLRKIEKRIRLRFSDRVKINKIDELAITPTMNCCLNCAMCHQKEIKHWPNMPYETFKKILINLKKQRVSKISLVGGEIFVHPEMWRFIDLMEQMGFKYDISSNLFFVPGGVEKFAKFKGLEMVTTSIDGIGEQHSKIRGVARSFEKTVDNIKKIVSMKLHLDVACVVQKANMNNLEQIVEFICKLKVKSITLLVENNLTEQERKMNKQIIKRVTGKDSEVLVSAIKNPLGMMGEKDWEIVLKKMNNLRKIVKKYGATLNLATQLAYSEVLKERFVLKNYTCGIFQGYNMIAYNDASLPFCGFIKLRGDYGIDNKNPLKISNSPEYLKLRRFFYKYAALPMCRLCCALKRR